MQNLLSSLLPRLEAHQLPDLNTGEGSFHPFYEGYSLVNLPASICHWLGIPTFGSQPLGDEILNQYKPGFQHVILLVVDGMGLNTLQKVLEGPGPNGHFAVWGELAQQATLAPLTSIVPSTTASALTTFWTGCPPSAHGVMGYEMWLKEYSLIANMILQSPASFTGDVGSLRKAGFNPEAFLPVPTLGPHLLQHGIQPHAFQHQAIAKSGLSTMLMPGVDIHPYRSLSDLWVTLSSLLDAGKNERNYYYIYWGDLDEHSHRFGPEDTRVLLELANFSRQLEYFIRERQARNRQDTLLIITADHGHISTPRNPHYEIRNHPDLLKTLVMPPSGEARLPYVYLRHGCDDRFLQYLERTWPGEFLPVPSGQAIQARLFGSGSIYERLPERTGDYVIIAQGSAYWWFGSRDNQLLGRHGGMSRTEMLAPFFAAVV